MNILGIGAPELIVILMIAIIVAGPKRMIRWAYVLGQYVGKLRIMWGDVAKMIQAEVDAAGLDVQVPTDLPNRANVSRMIQQAAKPLSDPLNKAAREVEDEYRRTQKEVSAVKPIEQIVAAAQKHNGLPAAPALPELPTPTSEFGSWGASHQTNGAAQPVSPTSPDLGTWGTRSDADVPDRP